VGAGGGGGWVGIPQCRCCKAKIRNLERTKSSSGGCWLQESGLGASVLEPGNGVICGMPGERKAGGSTIPPQTAFVKKAFRAELKGGSTK
jgi:hypothetical protein